MKTHKLNSKSSPIFQFNLLLRKIMLALIIILFTGFFINAQDLSQNAINQINALIKEKQSRTPEELKISSQLIFAIKMSMGRDIAEGVKTLNVKLVYDAQGRVKVNIKGAVSGKLLNDLKLNGSEIIFSSEKYRSLVAAIPLSNLMLIAGWNEVEHITEWMAPYFDKASSDNDGNPPGNGGGVITPYTGSVTAEADATHLAAAARTSYNVNGTGIKVGIISNGVDGFAGSQATNDIPAGFQIIPGQAGSGSEGLAMSEIVYDIVPGSQLAFATVGASPAQMATNIASLRAAGCAVISDDVNFPEEGVFQDDVVSQAINTAVASGAMYFSSAGNAGNFNDGNSGVWEGDFSNGGVPPVVLGSTGVVHNFGGQIYDVELTTGFEVTLKWSDALGASGNDYDLFETNNVGTALTAASTSVQNGNDDPLEAFAGTANSRLYIVKFSGATRALHLNTHRGRLTIGTSGNTYGHHAGLNTFCVAATPVNGPFPNPFTSANSVETFSSDGFRKIFYTPNGTPITPGNLLFSTNGGTTLYKPDMTAADGSQTTVPGFMPFFGTSAASPTAAAISALVLSSNPALTRPQLYSCLLASALDIEAPGVDQDAGIGIIMAPKAVATGTRICPTFNATVLPATQIICSGSLISNIVSTTNVLNVVFNWTRNNTGSVTGIASSGSGTISGSLTNTTNAPVTVTFTVTPTFTNAYFTCSGGPMEVTVTVNPVPNAIATPPSQTICSQDNITTIVLSGNVPGTVFSWTRNNTATATGIAASGTGNISGSLTNTTNSPVIVEFTITPSYTNGGKTCTGNPIVATVTVNPKPVPHITSSSGWFSVCNNSSIILDAGQDTGGPFAQYLWSTGATTETIAVNSGNIYAVTVTNPYGCTGTDSKGVVLNLRQPDKPGNIAGPVYGLCNSIGNVFSIAPVPTADYYIWTVSNGSIMTGQGTNSITVNYASFSSSSIKVRAVNACGQSSERSINVYGKPTEPLTINGNKNGVCGLLGEIYSINPIFGATNYNWTVPSNVTIVSGQGTTALTVNFLNSFGSGNICCRAENACGNSSYTCINVNAKPQKPVIIFGPANVCHNQAGVIYSTPAVYGASSYTWQVPGDAIITSGQGTPSITVTFGTHSGHVEVRAGNACGTNSDFDLDVHIVCRENGSMNAGVINLYPNPAHGYFRLSITSEQNQKCLVRVIDLVGKQLTLDSFELNEGENIHEFNLTALAGGLYFVVIEREGLPTETIRMIME